MPFLTLAIALKSQIKIKALDTNSVWQNSSLLKCFLQRWLSKEWVVWDRKHSHLVLACKSHKTCYKTSCLHRKWWQPECEDYIMLLQLLDIDSFENKIFCCKKVENEVVISRWRWREGAREHVSFIKHYPCLTEQEVKWIEWIDDIQENLRWLNNILQLSLEKIILAHWIEGNVQKYLM